MTLRYCRNTGHKSCRNDFFVGARVVVNVGTAVVVGTRVGVAVVGRSVEGEKVGAASPSCPNMTSSAADAISAII